MFESERKVLHAKTHPSYLHANSTSHTWIFSAIAELIDNAYDAGAKSVHIDRYNVGSTTCLTITDDGSGLTPDKLHNMLSFGYCYKERIDDHPCSEPVGQYGNGFKSGSMRLGKDAMVFTKSDQSISVGLLSQTYLNEIQADTVLVPIVTLDLQKNFILKTDEEKDSLKDILQYSIFRSEEAILGEIEKLEKEETGTRIIIYNLAKLPNGVEELQFNTLVHDIINASDFGFREHHDTEQMTPSRLDRESIPHYRKSLREYCSILYLQPYMKIFLRKEKIKSKLITKTLKMSCEKEYKPHFLSKESVKKPCKIIFGYGEPNCDYGLLMYHRSRLIKAYLKIGCQKQDKGQRVVGVVEVDFLNPVHNKQDFNKNDHYNTCLDGFGRKLNEYCKDYVLPEERAPPEDESWHQCDRCLKWRRLLRGVKSEDLPQNWSCPMNADKAHNRCDIEQEAFEDNGQRKKRNRQMSPCEEGGSEEEELGSKRKKRKNSRQSGRTSTKKAVNRTLFRTRCDPPSADDDETIELPDLTMENAMAGMSDGRIEANYAPLENGIDEQDEHERGQNELEPEQDENEQGQDELEPEQSAHEQGQTELEQGQDELEPEQDEHEQGQDELEQGQDELEPEQDEHEQGQDKRERGQEVLEQGLEIDSIANILNIEPIEDDQHESVCGDLGESNGHCEMNLKVIDPTNAASVLQDAVEMINATPELMSAMSFGTQNHQFDRKRRTKARNGDSTEKFSNFENVVDRIKTRNGKQEVSTDAESSIPEGANEPNPFLFHPLNSTSSSPHRIKEGETAPHQYNTRQRAPGIPQNPIGEGRGSVDIEPNRITQRDNLVSSGKNLIPVTNERSELRNLRQNIALLLPLMIPEMENLKIPPASVDSLIVELLRANDIKPCIAE